MIDNHQSICYFKSIHWLKTLPHIISRKIHPFFFKVFIQVVESLSSFKDRNFITAYHFIKLQPTSARYTCKHAKKLKLETLPAFGVALQDWDWHRPEVGRDIKSSSSPSEEEQILNSIKYNIKEEGKVRINNIHKHNFKREGKNKEETEISVREKRLYSYSYLYNLKIE